MPHTVKNILVTGANGQLGNEIRMASKKSNDNYIFSDNREQEGVETILLDVTNAKSVKEIINDYKIDIIINCAAYTNVDACEQDDKLAYLAEQLNSNAPKILAESISEVNGLLIHISTDYVFGKEQYNTPCSTEIKCTPTGVYGLTKKNGEENIISTGCNYIILRTSWLYSEFGNNFCKTILNLISKKNEINVVFDQCGTPTYAFDLANAICHIIDKRKYMSNNGVFHYSNEGVTSWYDFAKMIALFSNNTKCDIKPCHSSDFKYVVKRPSYSVLDKTSFKDTFDLKIPYWIDSLKMCLNKILSK